MCTTDFRALMDVFTDACKEAGYVDTEKVDALPAGQKRARSPEPSSRGEICRGFEGTGTFKRGRYS
jgi:hypothetical protein